MKNKRLTAMILCIAVLLAFASGCSRAAGDMQPGTLAGTRPDGKSVSGGPAIGDETPDEIKALYAGSYADVKSAISQVRNTDYDGAMGGETVTDMAAENAGAPAPTASAPSTAAEPDIGFDDAAADKDFSETNTQTEGIDEGDIVKTDGNYIYILRNNELIILEADGTNSKKLAAVTVCRSEPDKTPYTEDRDGYHYGYEYEYANELYITSGAAVVLTSYNSHSETKQGDSYSYQSSQITKAYIYDTTNPSSPKLVQTLGQDGYPVTTRLAGNILYVISNYSVYSYDEDDYNTFIPRVYASDTPALIAPDCISILPIMHGTAYNVITAIDIPSRSQISTQTVLGGGNIVYMSQDNLYIAGQSSELNAGVTQIEDIYKVTSYERRSITDIARYELNGGAVTLKAYGTVEGTPYGQFALDEYDGNLRIAVTSYVDEWTEYADEKNGWINYKWGENKITNALCVLSPELTVLGSVTGLAETETIHSVRYSGDIAYIVTFRRTDPLFAIDLSDPSSPKVLSALKIPGFSQYMHVFSSGRLFGLGMDADPETGVATTMKLSMFNTDDPADVTEKHTLKLEASYSEALYNHKAVLISPAKNIIGFPANNGYEIYSYDDTSGFIPRASLKNVEWYGAARGLYIGEHLYIVLENKITVINMTDFTVQGSVTF